MKGDPSNPANWYQLARRDLDKGRKDLSAGDGPYAVIQFQQAVEKAC
jgi:HEPN domain-containing protein